LNKNQLVEAYRQSSKRLIFLDYEVCYNYTLKNILNYKRILIYAI